MKTPEQIKGAVRNVAKNNHIQPQAVLQMYLFERILERLIPLPEKYHLTI